MSAATSDDADRQRISFGVDRRCVVVAGAGSGKTTHLVQRVAETIARGVEPANVAVITFTDKAARELVHKLRAAAIAEVDDAYIGTIHGFCARILRSYPIDAGLPPKFTTADEITARTEAADRRRQILTDVYDAAQTDGPLLEAFGAIASEAGLGVLSSVVDVIDSQWHRFEHVPIDPPSADSLVDLVEAYFTAFDAFCGGIAKPAPTLVDSIAAHETVRSAPTTLRSALTFGPLGVKGNGGASKKPDRDRLTALRLAVTRSAAEIVIRRVVVAFRDLVVARARQRIRDGRLGYDDLLILTERLIATNPEVRSELRARYRRIFVDEFQDTDAVQFSIIDQLTAPGADCRAADGSDGSDGSFGSDGSDGSDGSFGSDGSDGSDGSFDGHEDGCDDGTASLSPRLFAVGDPKQSIYGFRNADVELFGSLADAAGAGGYLATLTANFRTRSDVAAWINTTMQRRFDKPAKVSKTVQEALSDDGSFEMPEPTVRYEALQPTRPAQADDELDPGPPVVLLGIDEGGTPLLHADTATAQEAEARDVVGLAQRVIDERWRVLEPAECDPDGRPLTWASRPAKRSDIAVLVARRTGLATLESRFRQAAIPFRVEGGTLAYENREVYELLRVARAIDNPSDELMLVTALRSSILGCSDEDLFAYRYRRTAGRGLWRLPSTSPEVEPPAALDDSEAGGVARVEAALSQVARWAASVHQMSPAMLLTTIYDSSMGVAAARFEGASAEVETWRRVRFLVDEARAWTNEVGGTLHEYLAWVEDKVDAVDRSEIAPDETDDDSVRILTIHAAKGLEFPIVIVAALGSKDNGLEDSFTLAAVDGRAEFKLGSLRSPGYPRKNYIAAFAEEARLLYVAMTRAKDHLVLSLHTSRRSSPNAAERLAPYADLQSGQRWSAESSSALQLPFSLGDINGIVDLRPVTSDELAERPDPYRRTVWTPSGLAARQRQSSSSAPAHEVVIEGSFAEQSIEDDDTDREGDEGFAARSFGRAGNADSTTAGDEDGADAGLHKDPQSGRDFVRSRGRYGTDIGIAVHEVMQLVDLADPLVGFDALVAGACDNVDLVGPARRRVAVLAHSLVASPLFTRMRSASVCEREVYVGTMVGDSEPIALWGYIDAVFQSVDGSYVVVDFKTDSVATAPHELALRYGVQLNAYGVAVERSTGGVVSELWLLVADAGGAAQQVAIQRRQPEWPTIDRSAAPADLVTEQNPPTAAHTAR